MDEFPFNDASTAKSAVRFSRCNPSVSTWNAERDSRPPFAPTNRATPSMKMRRAPTTN